MIESERNLVGVHVGGRPHDVRGQAQTLETEPEDPGKGGADGSGLAHILRHASGKRQLDHVHAGARRNGCILRIGDAHQHAGQDQRSMTCGSGMKLGFLAARR